MTSQRVTYISESLVLNSHRFCCSEKSWPEC